MKIFLAMIQNPEVVKAKIDKTNDKLGISICHFYLKGLIFIVF